jgi:hypothetical protein
MSVALVPVAIFTTLMLMAALHGLAASGHFPRETRLVSMRQGAGPALLWASIILVLACLLVGVFAAWHLIPWYAAVIGGGGGILVAPLVLRMFSDRFVDGIGSLILFAAVAACLAAAMLWLTQRSA